MFAQSGAAVAAELGVGLDGQAAARAGGLGRGLGIGLGGAYGSLLGLTSGFLAPAVR
jgi:hypothetical protein